MTEGEIRLLLILFGVAFLPSLAFLMWIRSTDRISRERWSPLLRTFFFGAIFAVVIALALEMAATAFMTHALVREYELLTDDPTLLSFLLVVVIAPVFEELAKASGVARARGAMGRAQSGLVFGAAAGLGFAATENLLYESSALFEGGVQSFILVATIRSLSSALMHASATAVSGYGIGRGVFEKRSWIPFYLLAVIMHSSFNLFASFGMIFEEELGPWASTIGLVAAFMLVVISVKAVRSKIRSRPSTAS